MALPSVRRMSLVPFALVALVALGGCSAAYPIGGDDCPAPLDCFEGAISVCADELTTGESGDPGCAAFDIVGSGTSCIRSRSRVQLHVRAEGATEIVEHSTVIEVPPGATFAGAFAYDTPCEDECYGGGGTTTDDVEVGDHLLEGSDSPARTMYYAFLGDGVVYHVELCLL